MTRDELDNRGSVHKRPAGNFNQWEKIYIYVLSYIFCLGATSTASYSMVFCSVYEEVTIYSVNHVDL